MVFSEKRYRAARFTSLTAGVVFAVLGGGLAGSILGEKSLLRPAVVVVAPFCGYLLYLFLMRKYRRRKRILADPFPTEWQAILASKVAYYSSLGPEDRERFNRQVQVFLGEKIITGVETDVDHETRLLVAASAVIPIMEYPDWEYDHSPEVLIYPRSFNSQYEFSGKGSHIIGLVATAGNSTLILSKPDLLAGFRNANDAQNVGIHEFMHKVDKADGVMDGIPGLLMGRHLCKRWEAVVDAEMEDLREGRSDMNPYALTNEVEFLAVAGEYFFEKPAVMSRKHPALYDVMKKVFKQDTMSLLKGVAKSFIRSGGKKIGRNSRCPCGSGKKYKKCCLPKLKE